jgi:hypothetical protein
LPIRSARSAPARTGAGALCDALQRAGVEGKPRIEIYQDV